MIKINTTIMGIFIAFITLVVLTTMYFQYSSSNQFAIMTTKKEFTVISNKVINKLQQYNYRSTSFLNILKTSYGVDDLPELSVSHQILPSIAEHIKTTDYIYMVYLGFASDNFYGIYNLALAPSMYEKFHAPINARWVVVKHLLEDGRMIRHTEIIDKNFNIINTTTERTKYKPSKRPWFKNALEASSVTKTEPYIFSSLQEPGVTYAKMIDTKKGSVIALDITLGSLDKLLSSQSLVKGSASFIFKKDGQLIGQFDEISNNKHKNLYTQYPNKFMHDDDILDLGMQKIVTINDNKYLKYTIMLDSQFASKDYLTILSPIDVIMEPYKNKIIQDLLITIVIIFIIIMMLIVIIRKIIVYPILNLVKENQKIKEGKYKSVKPVDTFLLEIEHLSLSLVDMSTSVDDLTTNLEVRIKERTVDLEIAKKEVEAVHKLTRESIEYASLIQGALIPQNGVMTPYFKDHFVTWIPKDTVGGDIWLFEDLRHKDECLLLFIDCTGHGVPGAFVTMIVKAVEREIISIIKNSPDMDVSPAWVMGYFNNTIKQLLRQKTKDSKSNAGWDGGVIYYNKQQQILKFAGAETPLFYMTKDGEMQTLKGNRYSVGYKKCAMDYEYKESIIEVEAGMKFYCTTDGYLDQNGGEKDFPFGKKRFTNIIKENHTKPMSELQTILQIEMDKYESKMPDNDRNDDMTVIAFEIDSK